MVYKYDDEFPPDHVFEDPLRLRVLKALSASLQGITPLDGYDADLSGDGEEGSLIGQVCRGRIIFGDTEPLPLVSILEPPIPLEPVQSRGRNPNSTGDWELLVQGFVKDDARNPSDPAHKLMAEVKTKLILEKRRMFPEGASEGQGDRNILRMRNKIDEMHIGQGAVRPADETSARCFFWLTLTLKLVENLENPYD